jgi:hypothetical protein
VNKTRRRSHVGGATSVKLSRSVRGTGPQSFNTLGQL